MSTKEKKFSQRWKELPFLYKIQIGGYLFAGICSAIAYPLTTKLIYSSVDTEVLAERLVLSSVIGIMLSFLWLTVQEKLYSWFIQFTACECLAYISLISYVICCEDYNGYLIWSTIIAGTIGHIVGGAGNKLHQKITDDEQARTDYGFFIEIVAAVGVLIGSGIAVIASITMPVAFILLLLGCIYFQAQDIYVYVKVKQKSE